MSQNFVALTFLPPLRGERRRKSAVEEEEQGERGRMSGLEEEEGGMGREGRGGAAGEWGDGEDFGAGRRRRGEGEEEEEGGDEGDSVNRDFSFYLWFSPILFSIYFLTQNM